MVDPATISGVRRVWVLSDSHWGVRANSAEWLDIQRTYFHDFFVPLIREHRQEGDCVIFCGDWFDNRQVVQTLTRNASFRALREISSVMPVLMLVGNHDTAQKMDMQENSLVGFELIPGVHVCGQTEERVMSGTRVRLLSWCGDDTEQRCRAEREVLSQGGDFLFCHTDVVGASFNRAIRIEHGNPADAFSGFRRCYSGHIHYAQLAGNIRFVGNPYQMTWSDSGNAKGVWLVDLASGGERFFANTVTPRFVQVRMEWVLSRTIPEVAAELDNNIARVLVPQRWSSFPFSLLTERLPGVRKLDFEPEHSDDDALLAEAEEHGGTMIRIMGLVDAWIEMQSYDPRMKDQLRRTAENLYRRALESTAETL